MNVKEILKKNEFLITEAGIRLPKGTKAAKILYHDDTDGIAAAKVVYDQLTEQGISGKNIIMRPVSDSTDKEAERQLLAKKPGQMLIAVDYDRFKNNEIANKNIDFHTDHHETQQMVRRGSGKTGQTQFKSDTSHLQTKYSKRKEPDFEKGITQVDSADFGDDFEDAVLNKISPKKKGGDRLRRLANVTNSLIVQMTRKKRNEAAAEALAKESKQSIPSFYNTALKYAKLNNKQVEAIKELQKKNPDMDKVDKIRNEVKEKGNQQMANAIQKNNPQGLKKISLPEETRETAASNVERMQKELDDPESGKITKEDGVIVQNIMGKGQPGRYTNFMLKGSGEINAQLREWATMLQFSLSPKMAKSVKEQVNLTDIMQEVLEEVRKEFANKYNSWAFDIIQRESGGHAGITNVVGLGTIGIMPKKLRNEMKELRGSDKYQRYKKLPKERQKKLSSLEGFSELENRLKELEKEKKEWAKERQKIKDEIKDRMIKKINEKIDEAKKSANEEFVSSLKTIAEGQ